MQQETSAASNATMTTDMQLFSQQLGDHTVAISALLVGDEPWFRGNDVAFALGYANLQQAIRTHVHDQDRQTLNNLRVLETSTPLESNEGAQVFINESGVYSLIMRSRKAEARLFQRWVTKEVLPSIRRSGQYTAPTEPPPVQNEAQSGPTPYDLEMLRGARMQSLTAAFNAAQVIGSSSQVRVQAAVQKAIDDALLPPGESPEQYIDATQILLERGHTDEQASRLAGELGKDLKLVGQDEERNPQSREQQYGMDKKQVGLYHRVRDAQLIETVLASFKARELYTRVMTGQPDPIRARREELLRTKGRGRSRSERRGVRQD